MHFCQNLGGSRVPPMTSLLQWERVRSFVNDKEIGDFWVPIHDQQNEGELRDFYNNQVLNFTSAWGKGEPNGETSENCVMAKNEWYDVKCKTLLYPCLCQRQSSIHMRLREVPFQKVYCVFGHCLCFREGSGFKCLPK